jgi:hypothetical protein
VYKYPQNRCITTTTNCGVFNLNNVDRPIIKIVERYADQFGADTKQMAKTIQRTSLLCWTNSRRSFPPRVNQYYRRTFMHSQLHTPSTQILLTFDTYKPTQLSLNVRPFKNIDDLCNRVAHI